jgi:hypothetical protein
MPVAKGADVASERDLKAFNMPFTLLEGITTTYGCDAGSTMFFATM